MRKHVLILAALTILGVAAGLSLTNKKSTPVQPSSPKCAENCTKAKKKVPVTGFFIMDSYQGIL
ncbi:MAG TPA: hypothetical protein VFV46_06990 [Lacibacter sp.]|nr:hypothetical protein [Lacibacter sp.]